MPKAIRADVSALSALSEGERRALAAFLAGLQEQYAQHVAEVILFGSRARGEGGEESDVDLLVLVRSEDWHLWWDIPALAARSSLAEGRSGVLSAKVMSTRHYARLARLQSPLYRSVRSDGVLLWRNPSMKT
jgi:hypothetical protein